MNKHENSFFQARREMTSSDARAEESMAKRVAWIFDHLGFREDDLRGKKVADIGAGDRSVAAYCLLNKVSKDVYSVEPNLKNLEWEKRNLIDKNFPELIPILDAKTVMARDEALPFPDNFFDFALDHAALPPFRKMFMEGKKDEVKKIYQASFHEMVRVLKPEGRLHLYPLEKGRENEDETLKPRMEVLGEVIEELKNEGHGVEMEKIENERRMKDGEPETFWMTRLIVTKRL